MALFVSEMMLFTEKITDLKDWGGVFQNKTLFLPLAQEIFRQCGLPEPQLENCCAGSNAVFRAGEFILKVFAPEQSGIGGEGEFRAEIFGLERAAKLGIPAPRLLHSGVLADRYIFRWILLEYVQGRLLADAAPCLTSAQWHSLGLQLRHCVERMDTPCDAFTGKPLGDAASEKRWELFPQSFRQQRKAFLSQRHTPAVFVHGDLNADNLMVTPDHRLVLIDFADCRTAPYCTELAALVCDAFRFERAYLQGFLGDFHENQLSDELLEGLLRHDYGAWIIRDRLGDPAGILSLSELQKKLCQQLHTLQK